MDEAMLTAEGYYSIYGSAGARTEMPGCSLCMGNQARVADDCSVVSTSTRNFPNRLGKGANVFLASAELASVAAMLGRLPTVAEYMEEAKKLDTTAEDTYRYLNFDQLPEYVFTERVLRCCCLRVASHCTALHRVLTTFVSLFPSLSLSLSLSLLSQVRQGSR